MPNPYNLPAAVTLAADALAALVHAGAVFFVNHSGGKDSQAMAALVERLVSDLGGADHGARIVYIHAPLVDVEWEGTEEHIRATIGDRELLLAHATRRDGTSKTLLDVVDARGMFPDASRRWCTSDFKRGPIEREIRRWVKREGHTGPIVSCMGLRAEESCERSKGLDKRHHNATGESLTFKLSKGNSKAGRTWYDWLPIFDWMTDQVWGEIEAAGQTPHWAYGEGMTRLSCCFCLYGSKGDLTLAAQLNPALYARYCETEKRLNHTLSMSRKPLPEITGIQPNYALL